MAAGFTLATLQPVIEIINIFDIGKGIPDKFFDPKIDIEDLTIERAWLTDEERYSLEMMTEKRHEMAGLISLYPMIYCLGGLILTLAFRRPIILWFEVILYTEEEQEAEERRRAREQDLFDDLRELTLNDEDEEEGAANQRRIVKLKTYSFKKPQFMKKLTNTYFKKSKQSEKAVILHKELTSQKLHFSMHKKNSKSLTDETGKPIF